MLENIQEKLKDNKLWLGVGLVVLVLIIIIFLMIKHFTDYSGGQQQAVKLKEIKTTATSTANKNNQTSAEENKINLEKTLQYSKEFPAMGLDDDLDGLFNDLEKKNKTNPKKADTDDDGLDDYAEVIIYKTDPLNPDTDGDGHSDGDEVKKGFNPNGPGKLNIVNK